MPAHTNYFPRQTEGVILQQTICANMVYGTKSLVQSQCKQANPREVMYKTITEDLGGVASCSSLGQVPRNRQQVKDFARNRAQHSSSKNLSGPGQTNDPWYRLLAESKSQGNNKSTAFIRDVRVTPEPLCVLTTDRQLNDLINTGVLINTPRCVLVHTKVCTIAHQGV